MHSCLLVLDYMLIYYYTTPFYPACKGSGRTSRAKKGIKKHPEKASHLCPMQAELGIGDGRP